MQDKIVEYSLNHPLKFYGMILGATLALGLFIIAVDIGWNEFCLWLGGWTV